MKTPLFVSIAVVLINIISNLILVRFLAHGGLALGNSISLAVGVTLLLLMIRRKGLGAVNRAFAKKCFKALLAAIIAVGTTWFFFIGARALFAANGWILPRTVLLGVTVLLAAGIYLLLLRRLRIPELIHIKEIFR
jgi:putative peptidoglycan lipid II flippase